MPSLKGSFDAADAKLAAYKVRDYLIEDDNVLDVQIAGSLRRAKSTVGDVDLVATVLDISQGPSILQKIALKFNVTAGGSRASLTLPVTLSTTNGSLIIPVDINLTTQQNKVFAMMHHTGSKEENIRLRYAAMKLGWSISQNGLVTRDTKVSVLMPTCESDVYEKLGVEYREPKNR